MSDPGFLRGGFVNPSGGGGGALTHDFVTFTQKLHEIKRIWTGTGGRGTRPPPLDSPMHSLFYLFLLSFFLSVLRFILSLARWHCLSILLPPFICCYCVSFHDSFRLSFHPSFLSSYFSDSSIIQSSLRFTVSSQNRNLVNFLLSSVSL